MVIFSSNYTFWILLFLYYSFGVEKTNTFIRPRGSLENHTRFKTIMVKIYTRFQTKTARKPYPLGRHNLYSLYRGVPHPPPPPPRGRETNSHNNFHQVFSVNERLWKTATKTPATRTSVNKRCVLAHLFVCRSEPFHLTTALNGEAVLGHPKLQMGGGSGMLIDRSFKTFY